MSGSVYVTGFSQRSSLNDDYTTIKYNSAGQEQWVRRYSGPWADRPDHAKAIAIDGLGNVYVTGEISGGDYYGTIKYNSAGQQLWIRRYTNGHHDDSARAIALDGSGNIYVTGWSGSDTALDFATVKYNSSGQEWVARYNGPANNHDGGDAIAVDGSGNIYVTGSSVGIGASHDYLTIKYDSAGQQQWIARYNGPGNGEDNALAMAIDGSGNVYVTGYSIGSGSDYDFATIKYVQVGTPTPTPTPTVQVTVHTNPAGLAFSVDGTPYSSAQTFTWESGSSHTIATTSPQNGAPGVRYVWMNWTGGGAISHTVAPTINKTYTATFRTQYYLTMSHNTGGRVSPASGWKASGATVSISATPANGYTFSNWTGSGTGSYSGTNNPASITINGPITETATFTHN
jgi:hypothetical protein